MNFATVEKIAAALLYEGYILYPYRPTAIKNRQRWNFGTLYPRVYAEAQHPQEPSRFVAECLIEAGAESAALDLKIQFLQLIRPSSKTAAGLAPHSLTDPSLDWDEAVERRFELTNLRVDDSIESELTLPLELDASGLPGNQGGPALHAQLIVAVEALSNGACKLRLALQNLTSLPSGAEASREEALPRSFVSAHLLLGISGGRFISLLDPAEMYREAAAACCNVGVFPVLAGEEPDRTMMLCSPIILYDYPRIAPESEGDFFDGTEMDEMLTLRVLTLTDAEKQEMRSGDSRARRILERTEALSNEAMMKSHGAIRGMRAIRQEDFEDAP